MFSRTVRNRYEFYMNEVSLAVIRPFGRSAKRLLEETRVYIAIGLMYRHFGRGGVLRFHPTEYY